MKKRLDIVKYFASAAMLFFALYLLIIYRSSVGSGILQGISYSLSILIPSLMPFMLISSLFSVSLGGKLICKITAPAMKFLFKLPAEAAPAVIFGLSCGYPIGSKLTSELLSDGKITADEAARLLIFTLNPGIPFCVLFVGAVCLNNIISGWLFYGVLVVSSILLGFILSIGKKAGNSSYKSGGELRFFPALKKSTDSTVRACLNMCFYVVVFWGILALLHSSGAYQFIVKNIPIPFLNQMEKAGALSFIIEVTSGINDSVNLGLSNYIFLFGLSFGGICIHLQVFSFFKIAPISYWKFLLYRLFHAFLSLSLFSLVYPFFRSSLAVFSTTGDTIIGGYRGNFVASVSLILLFALYVLILGKEKLEKPIKK